MMVARLSPCHTFLSVKDPSVIYLCINHWTVNLTCRTETLSTAARVDTLSSAGRKRKEKKNEKVGRHA